MFDSSSLIFSLKVREIFDLLSKNFSSFAVPPVVFSEVVEAGRFRGSPEVRLVEELLANGVLKKSANVAPIAATGLHAGESQAIATARKLGVVCLSDDRKAYTVGLAIGVKVVSLPAFLVVAVRNKQVSPQKAEELLSRLVQQGYYLKTADYLRIIQEMRK